jgi:cell division protein FtsB
MAKNIKSKNKKKKFRFFAVFLVFFMAFMVYKCCGQVYEIHKLNSQKSDLEGTYAQIQEDKESLEEQKALLNDDTYLERLARENLLMVREGEYLVVPYEENDEVVEYDGVEGEINEDVH